MASLKTTFKKSLKKAFGEIGIRFAGEIVSALADVGVEELRDAPAGLRGKRRASRTPRGSRRSKAPRGAARKAGRDRRALRKALDEHAKE